MTSEESQKLELLMPAGTLSKLKVGVLEGANAIYFGTTQFNARRSAQNFTMEEIKEGIDFCHINSAKAYLTLNILLKDSELKEAIEIAKQVYVFGIDAIIVQDLGLLKALRELLPDLELHASTQLACHNLQGAEFLADIGFSTIVLARELSLEEIKEISTMLKKRGVRTEVFIHGAECFSYSGQCLFSSFAFNKSGNRGQCLQPCRMHFTTNTDNKGYLLSMKDLCTYDIMKDLVEAGIDSFKVEGRLKSETYISNVAKVYRKSIDGIISKQAPKIGEIKEMKKSFLRKHGHLYLKSEKDLITLNSIGHEGIPVGKVLGFKKKHPVIELMEGLKTGDKITAIIGERYKNLYVKRIMQNWEDIDEGKPGDVVELVVGRRPFLEKGDLIYLTTPDDKIESSESKTSYNLSVQIVKGKKITAKIKVCLEEMNFELDYVPEDAQKQPTTSEIVKDKLFKEIYSIKPGKFDCSIGEGLFVPLSRLKELKKLISEGVKTNLYPPREINEGQFKTNLEKLLKKEKTETKENKKKDLFIFTNAERIDLETKGNLESIQQVYLYSEDLNIIQQIPDGALVKPANIQSTEELNKFEKNVKNKKWNIFCSNLGTIQVALNNKTKILIDRELNCFNSLAIDFFSELGAEKIVPSVELALSEILKLKKQEKLVPMIFFYPLLMTSRAYSKDNAFGKDKFVLTDRKCFNYRVRFEENYMKIYNPVPVDMLFELEKFKSFKSLGIDMKNTSKKEARAVIKYFSDKVQGKNADKSSKFTRGHYSNPVT